jgi:hypothetical protein
VVAAPLELHLEKHQHIGGSDCCKSCNEMKASLHIKA